MKWHRMKRILAVLSSVALLGSLTALSSAAEEPEAYSPNRAFTIVNESAPTAALNLTALPYQLGAQGEPNGPYHLWARMNIDGLEAVDGSREAGISVRAKYGYYTAGSSQEQYKTVELCSWTADTDGWVDMTMPDGPHLALEAIDPSADDDVYCDVTVEFVMTNAKGTFQIADLVIADKDDTIVYSLANDPCFSAITDFSRRMSSEPSLMWSPQIDRSKTAITVTTAKSGEYIPNRVLTMDIPANAEGETSAYPESFGYLHLNVNNPPTTVYNPEDGPFTMRGMVKVEDFAVNASQLTADAEVRAQNAAFLIGNPLGTYHGLIADTDGWVPLLNGDGTPITFTYEEAAGEGKMGWYPQFFCSWGATGKYSLADFAVLDKNGNVVYSFETDTLLTDGATYKPGTNPPSDGTGGLYLWANDYVGVDNNTRIDYRYEVADETTEHTAADYALRTFEEVYVPYESGEQPTTPPTGSEKPTEPAGEPSAPAEPTPSPETGAALPLAVLPLAALGLTALLVTRRRQR